LSKFLVAMNYQFALMYHVTDLEDFWGGG